MYAAHPVAYYLVWMVLGLVMAANPYDSAFATLGRIFGGGARKRMPILTVETNGDARIDLWCRTVPARVEIADMAMKIEAAPLPGDLPAMQGAGQCTPERIKADEEMLASIVQVKEWRRDGDAILLMGPVTMKFRPATN